MKKASIAPASPARRASSAPRVTQVLAANAGEAEMARVHALNFVSTNFTVDKRGQKSVSKLKTVAHFAGLAAAVTLLLYEPKPRDGESQSGSMGSRSRRSSRERCVR
jgi:hypothetical protein